jgi:hypothetical protein
VDLRTPPFPDEHRNAGDPSDPETAHRMLHGLVDNTPRGSTKSTWQKLAITCATSMLVRRPLAKARRSADLQK